MTESTAKHKISRVLTATKVLRFQLDNGRQKYDNVHANMSFAYYFSHLK